MSLPWQDFRLTKSEWHILRKVVVDWVEDGFSIPPYHPCFYDILDRLDIQQKDIQQYDISRPVKKEAGDGSFAEGSDL